MLIKEHALEDESDAVLASWVVAYVEVTKVTIPMLLAGQVAVIKV